MYILLDHALTAAQTVLQHLAQDKKHAVVAVCDNHGELILLLKTDHAPYSSIQIATNKAFTAAREKTDSMNIGNLVRDNQVGYHIQYWGDARMTGFGGGLVIKTPDGHTIGAIAVSGLPEVEDIYYAGIGRDIILKLQSNA